MVVLADVAVEARVRAGQLVDQPLGHQQAQVAVHRAQAHAGQAAADHLVDPLRGGVRLGGAHHVEHHAPWAGEPEAAGPERGLRAVHLFRNDSHYGSAEYRLARPLSSAAAQRWTRRKHVLHC